MNFGMNMILPALDNTRMQYFTKASRRTKAGREIESLSTLLVILAMSIQIQYKNIELPLYFMIAAALCYVYIFYLHITKQLTKYIAVLVCEVDSNSIILYASPIRIKFEKADITLIYLWYAMLGGTHIKLILNNGFIYEYEVNLIKKSELAQFLAFLQQHFPNKVIGGKPQDSTIWTHA